MTQPYLEKRKVVKLLKRYEELANERDNDAERDGMLLIIEAMREELPLEDDGKY